MKILVIQLTRLGDILCTVPTLLALRRENPNAEIHFLVRRRYASAARLAKVYDHLWQFDTQKIIGSFITEDAPVAEGLEKLKIFIQELRQQKFDRIINLSFSPTSSFVTHLVAQDKIPVLGYTRTSDFYLSLPDQASVYFRSQVGLDRNNRLHVVDLMAWVAGVELRSTDLHLQLEVSCPRKGIVCHVGASTDQKTWPEISWISFLTQLLNAFPNQSVTLIGSKDEIGRANNISLQVASSRLINEVGKTLLNDLFNILRGSELFIGCDSGPLHMASLAQCPTLNLSVGHVRFWETGPTLKGSRILRNAVPEHLISETVLDHAKDILTGGCNYSGSAVCAGRRGVRYDDYNTQFKGDCWSVLDWMYFGGPKPVFKGDLPQGLNNIAEVCDIALKQIDILKKDPQRKEVIQILDRLDDVLELIRKNISPLAPLIEEYRVAKENIPPLSTEEVFYQTRECYRKLETRVNTLRVERSSHEGQIISKNLEG